MDRRELRAADFVYSSNSGQSAQYWPVLSYAVPVGMQAVLPAMTPFLLYLCTSETLAHGGTGAEELSLTGRAADCLGEDTDGGDFVAIGADGVTYPVTAATFATGKVTVDCDVAQDVTIYYRPSRGSVRLSIVVPTAGASAYTIMTGDLGTWHTRDQFDASSRLQLSRAFGLAQDWQLQVQVRSTNVIVASAANMLVKFPIMLGPAVRGFETEARKLLR